MHFPFRFKLGLLLVILVIPLLISQAAYKQTISSLHGTLFSSVDILNAIHATETFHASLHGMLNSAKQFTVDRARQPNTDEWDDTRQKAQKSLEALLNSHHERGDHGAPIAAKDDQQSNEITALYKKFLNTVELVFTGRASESERHLKAAQKLFDDLFKNHLETLHTGHQERLAFMKSEAHSLKQRIDYLFYGQTVLLCLIIFVAVCFSEKILVRGYLQTQDESFSDGLTKARNRHYLETVTKREVANLVERDTSFSVALIDIDFFKRVNDQFGHQAGDDVLRTVADIIRRRLRKSDTFVRYGGEEFLIVLPGAEKTAAVDIVEKIRESIGAQAFVFSDDSDLQHVTASAGVASFPKDGPDTFRGLQKMADDRLYRAKSKGRNQCVSDDTTIA